MRLIDILQNTSQYQDRRISYMPYNDESALKVFEAIGKALEPKFSITDKNKPVYKELIKYIHGDPEFNGDLLKGIALIGNTGSGKSLAFMIMLNYMEIDQVQWVRNQLLSPFRFRIVSSKKIVADYVASGIASTQKYINPTILCLDDLGTEINTANHFGTNLNVLQYILEERYLLKTMLHFTSNYTHKILGEMYGERVDSRLSEQVNFLELVCPDWRKNK